MKTICGSLHLMLLAVTASLLALPLPHTTAQTLIDEVEVVRSALRSDRQTVIADAMQFTEAESAAFWPLYREYRVDMEKVGDGIIKLILEYADAYPNVSEERAEKLLKDYLTLEKEWVNVRAKHLTKTGKILPKSKVLRLAQLENGLDLVLRLQMASAVPLVPVAETTFGGKETTQ